jgi:hypothetical protein
VPLLLRRAPHMAALGVLCFTGLVAGTNSPAEAIPAFSMQTGLQCDSCHAAMRKTNELGDSFLHNGLRLPGGKPIVALRGQLAYTSEPDPSLLPKATVDEVEAFLSAPVNREFSVAAQLYLIDGGRPGSTREAWIQYASPGSFAGAPVRATVGSITLPLPVHPETFRQTNRHYAVFDQTVGANPFAFIDPRNAASLALGSPVRGPSVTLVAAQGHDPHSGLSQTGTDRMIAAQEAIGGLVLSAYDYAGRRELGAIGDDFRRRAVGVNLYRGRLAVETLLQTGFNTSPNGDGVGIASSGGFLQLRYQLPRATFVIVRYDGVDDTSGGAFARSLTIGATRLVSQGMRVGLEDVIAHGPRTTHTLNATLGFGVSSARVGSGAY